MVCDFCDYLFVATALVAANSWVNLRFLRGKAADGSNSVCQFEVRGDHPCGQKFSATTSATVLAKHLVKVHNVANPNDSVLGQKRMTAFAVTTAKRQALCCTPAERVTALWAK
jgi:hypothetical protein